MGEWTTSRVGSGVEGPCQPGGFSRLSPLGHVCPTLEFCTFLSLWTSVQIFLLTTLMIYSLLKSMADPFKLLQFSVSQWVPYGH